MNYLQCLVFYLAVSHVFHQRLFKIGYHKYLFRCWILPCWNIGKATFDLFLHFPDINVSDNYNCLQVRTIPFVIKVEDFFPFEIVNHLESADNAPLGLLASSVYQGILFHSHPCT